MLPKEKHVEHDGEVHEMARYENMETGASSWATDKDLLKRYSIEPRATWCLVLGSLCTQLIVRIKQSNK
jgi:hypothetical protein